MDSFLNLFGQYYGLDWLSVATGLWGLYLVTEQRRIGFVFTILSVCCAAIAAVMAHQYGFLVANILTAVLALRGYVGWNSGKIAR